MAKYTKRVEVWNLTAEQRGRLQTGQHITAGGAPGRWYGQTRVGTDVAMYRASVARGGAMEKMRRLIEYARGI